MNKPETERLEIIHKYCIDQSSMAMDMANTVRAFASSNEVGIRCEEERSAAYKDVSEIIEHHIQETTKGKTAVTFYIPEGMTIGEAITRSMKNLDRVDDLIHVAAELSFLNAEQIQEAIDNTFTENK